MVHLLHLLYGVDAPGNSNLMPIFVPEIGRKTTRTTFLKSSISVDLGGRGQVPQLRTIIVQITFTHVSMKFVSAWAYIRLV